MIRGLLLVVVLTSSACRAKTSEPAIPGDTSEARHLRERLLTKVADNAVAEPRVLRAMRDVPRHLFVPTLPLAEAYSDKPLPTDEGQTTTQPSLVALMTSALEVRAGDRVLEIGTGSGYQTAVLAKLAREVFTVEILTNLSRSAKSRLEALRVVNVQYRIGDGYRGWPEHAPFDRILITAAPKDVPPAVLDQLADGGVLVAPIGEWGPAPRQRLVRIRKNGGTISQETLGTVRFTPLVPME